MEISLQHFTFSLYRLTLEAKKRIELTRFNKGITLRGAFGLVFRRLVCHDLKVECNGCDLHASCPYAVIFSPMVPRDAERLRLNRDIPRRFVIKPPLHEENVYEPGGIPFRLTLIVRVPAESLSFAQFVGAEGNSVKSLKLEFVTPVLLKQGGRWAKPEFSALMKRLRDRINALFYLFCGQALDLNFVERGERAEQILTVLESLEWVEERRYSKHRNLRHVLRGYVGEMELEGELGPFMPMLKLGEFLHVGKATAFGQGWYRIVQQQTIAGM